jgi:hypothetical protein
MSCRISEVVEYVGQKTVATSKVTMSLVFRPPKPRDLSQVQFEEIVVAGYKFMIGKGGVRRSRHDDLLEKIHQDPICLEAVHRLQRLLLDKGYYMVDDFIIVKHALDNPRKDDAEVHAAFMNSKSRLILFMLGSMRTFNYRRQHQGIADTSDNCISRSNRVYRPGVSSNGGVGRDLILTSVITSCWTFLAYALRIITQKTNSFFKLKS